MYETLYRRTTVEYDLRLLRDEISNANKIQQFQNIALGKITNAPPPVTTPRFLLHPRVSRKQQLSVEAAPTTKTYSQTNLTPL